MKRNSICFAIASITLLYACAPSAIPQKPIENKYRPDEVLTRAVNGAPMRAGTLESGRRYEITQRYTRIVDRRGDVFLD